ncbi:MAG: spore germination protein [Clostridia bacterium]|nr:spore germination protein [Clostridia bacterium]
MTTLSCDYPTNIALAEEALMYGKSFDVLKKKLCVAKKEVTFFYIDGFVKDGELQRVMQFLLNQKQLGDARETEMIIPYVEVARTGDLEIITTAVLAGQTVFFSETFGTEAILLDLRTYPVRGIAEPESDRVMQGARDGFVETLIMNTALLRRRIRDPRLTMRHFDIGGSSHTDVVVCYMDGVAKPDYVDTICEKIQNAKPKTLTLGTQSLAESLIRRRWFNPFPKVRTTERPDTAAAQVLEGNVLVFCDTSPEVMILPTSIFDFTEEADDYAFPPLTGSYLRIVRIIILLLSVVVTPLWYLALEYREALPPMLTFLVPDEPGALPIILQLFMAELALDGLKLASMNTPDMLSNSLSVVGALILGDFAVSIGWFSEDVIFYMACVAIANFAQQSQELGYAFKFIRMIILTLVYFLDIYGFIIGLVLFCVFAATNTTVAGIRHYLYPLIPFDARACARHLFRFKKNDFEKQKNK